jgi:hypothetical protein
LLYSTPFTGTGKVMVSSSVPAAFDLEALDRRGFFLDFGEEVIAVDDVLT